MKKLAGVPPDPESREEYWLRRDARRAALTRLADEMGWPWHGDSLTWETQWGSYDGAWNKYASWELVGLVVAALASKGVTSKITVAPDYLAASARPADGGPAIIETTDIGTCIASTLAHVGVEALLAQKARTP